LTHRSLVPLTIGAMSDPLELQNRLLKQAAKSFRGGTLELFEARFKRYFPDLLEALGQVYPHQLEDTLNRALDILRRAYKERSADLRRLDLERNLRPDWFQSPNMIGYVAYADRFADTLEGVREKIGYLEELSVNYLHLMPLLEPRPGQNDGGYAVQNFREVQPDLGSMDDLETLAGALREKGISLCLDLVLNHVAEEHEWAQKARSGDEKYQNYFFMFPDRTLPDQYEQNLREIFPEFKPGNFTWDEVSSRWVWTTFNAYQWDLNWSNPDVWLEFAEIILYLANRGVDVFRLDAIAFIWKKLGTNSENQPEVHALTQALHAMARIAAPAVAFKAEAIVAPADLIQYLGQGAYYGKVSDLAYHNSFMVQIWSSLASRDTRLLAESLEQFPAKPSGTAWATYLRCHDDIGWAIDDSDAARQGMNGAAHRSFLSDYYSGQFPGSDARGLVFQFNPATGDRRISGSAASLAGLEVALEKGDEGLITLALERLLLGHALVLGFGGIPLLYMGDELALLNDYSFEDHSEHAQDNRWVHRPRMDWREAEKRKLPYTVEGRMFGGLQKLIAARKKLPHLHASLEAKVHWQDNRHLLLLERSHPLGRLVQVYNFADTAQPFPTWLLGIQNPFDHLSGYNLGGTLELAPYGRMWVSEWTGNGDL